jgi:hypothetical protein
LAPAVGRCRHLRHDPTARRPPSLFAFQAQKRCRDDLTARACSLYDDDDDEEEATTKYEDDTSIFISPTKRRFIHVVTNKTHAANKKKICSL